MSCNSESRRAINYSLQEPINNKYDLWLSENLRYNSEGLLIYDSPGQPACDLILKIYKDGDWKPIAGLNTEHIVANKINIVDGVDYTYISLNDNTLHTNNGFQQNHLPLFRNPQDSPNELFDAGTLGEAIYGFVNESEWKNIFEGNAFNNSFKWYFKFIVNNGDININELLEPAEATKLGGIWADEFSIEDMFPDSEAHDSHSQTEINDSYNWIAQAKYKLNHGTSDYNLYVSAKDIIGAINHYQIENHEAPGIQPGSDFLWRLANTVDIGGIRADTHDMVSYAFKPVECKFYPNYTTWNNLAGRLSVNAWDVQEALNEIWQEHPGSEIVSGWKGIETLLRDGLQGVWIGLTDLDIDKAGKFCMAQLNNSDPSGVSIEWVDLPEGEIYDLLGPGSSASERYVVKGGGKAGEYLDYEGNWTHPDGTEYQGGTFIRINLNNIIDVRPNNDIDTRKTYLCSYNGSVSWDVINIGSLYNEGVGIKFGNNNSINIDTTGADTGQVLSYDGDNGIEWVNPPSLVEGNNINTFVSDNKIYIMPYLCAISENVFTLDRLLPVSISDTYSNSRYPFVDFTDYQVEYPGGVSSITIESGSTPYLQYPSYMHFETSTKCTFTFPKTMEFIETKSVNSLTGEDYYYDDTDYIIELKPETKYIVTFYKSCIKFETNSNSIFDQPLNE